MPDSSRQPQREESSRTAITEASSALRAHVLSYGLDQTGLICGFRFASRTAAIAMENGADALTWLVAQAQSPSEEFVWLQFNLANASAQTLFAVMNDVLFDFAYDASHIFTLWLSVSERLLVSARFKPLRTVERLRATVASA